jgi:anti-anti-sigma factor
MNVTLLERKVGLPESVPQATLESDVEDLGDAVVLVKVRGEATGDRAADLDEQLRSSVRPGTRFVVLDLAGLTFIHPSALGALARFSRDLSRRGGEVWLASLQPAVWLALQVAGLARLFTIRTSLARALSS